MHGIMEREKPRRLGSPLKKDGARTDRGVQKLDASSNDFARQQSRERKVVRIMVRDQEP
ncbi:hypothetical protein K0M31_018792 [Melipona bicolor]|uniref:Uncharacterized protein n=1 Tax=Melipona bicolor TaxID=60889 RepID=A0AA40G430_9HYME|nr:hypothetical protein K0M31_018792 [Melipona bicolor]